MTLKEIAKLCNTSPATVSRVLNNYTKNFSVTPELRERILSCARQAAYTPNMLFKSMRTNTNVPISCLFSAPDIRFSYGTTIKVIETMIPILQGNGYQYNFSFAPEPGRQFYQKPFWKTQALVLPDVLSDAQLEPLGEPDCPMLILNGLSSRAIDAINNDEYANAKLLMECLHGFGHRRILYVDTPWERVHYSVPERLRCYQRLCGDFGISAQSLLYSDDTIQRAIAMGVTAILTYGQEQAQRLLYQCWRSGISVPNQLSIATFDDSDAATFSIPPLTCLRPDYAAMGQFAAKLLMARISGGEEQQSPCVHNFSGQLILRESVAACN